MLKKVYFVGAFPPPVCGLSLINLSIQKKFEKKEVELIVVNISARNLGKSIFTRILRMIKALYGLLVFILNSIFCNEQKVIYMSVSGGLGQVYELLYVVFARLLSMQIYLHHHSFAYIDKYSFITDIMGFFAGPSTVNIMLSKKMGNRLSEKYSGLCNTVTISNTVFFNTKISFIRRNRKSLKTIGFISNLTDEKGVFEFLDLVKACEIEGLDIRAKIAGPILNQITEQKINSRLKGLNTIDYLGPIYSKEKDEFYENIDVLIFPTKYVNEAEPLIVHEAMQHSVPVIAYGRGCIPEIVKTDSGLVIDPSQSFINIALNQIKQWVLFPEKYQSASRCACERFSSTAKSSEISWFDLEKKIIGDTDMNLKTGNP